MNDCRMLLKEKLPIKLVLPELAKEFMEKVNTHLIFNLFVFLLIAARLWWGLVTKILLQDLKRA
jgi:hypothetical protein